MSANGRNGSRHESAESKAEKAVELTPERKAAAGVIINYATSQPELTICSMSRTEGIGYLHKELDMDRDLFYGTLKQLVLRGIFKIEKSTDARSGNKFPMDPEALANDPELAIEIDIKKINSPHQTKALPV